MKYAVKIVFVMAIIIGWLWMNLLSIIWFVDFKHCIPFEDIKKVKL